MAAKAMSSSRFIYPARTVAKINIKGVDLFEVRWAPHHAYAVNTGNAIENPYHPRHLLAHRRWNQRTEPLWWNCLTSITEGGKKSVVRGWLNRRTRVAIKNALGRRGYAKDGSRLPDSPADSEKTDLIGSLHLFTTSKMLRAKWDEVSKQADLVVEGIEQKQKENGAKRRGKRR
jgi:hypothetical protein